MPQNWGHGQRGLRLNHHGQRPVVGLALHMPPSMRINSQKVWVLVASAILRRPRLIPSARMTFISPIR
ncbi:hypothetical protein AJ87_09155 [Rhizobium yanglingense]|nr:hypothetical protein AJ87_09155 [Rhizobium yanglingense]